MEKDNEQVVDAELQEETQANEVAQESNDTIAISKAEYKKLTRRSIAYDTLKAKPETITNPKVEYPDEVVETVKSLKMLEDKRQFGFEHGLSPQETDYAFKFSGGKPTKEILEDPFFKAGLDGLRSKQRLENNTPSSSSRSTVFQNKDFKEMSDDERRKAFEEAASKRKFNQ